MHLRQTRTRLVIPMKGIGLLYGAQNVQTVYVKEEEEGALDGNSRIDRVCKSRTPPHHRACTGCLGAPSVRLRVFAEMRRVAVKVKFPQSSPPASEESGVPSNNLYQQTTQWYKSIRHF